MIRRCDPWGRSCVIPGGCGDGECPYPEGECVEQVVGWMLERRAAVEGVAEQRVANRGEVSTHLVAARFVCPNLDERAVHGGLAR